MLAIAGNFSIFCQQKKPKYSVSYWFIVCYNVGRMRGLDIVPILHTPPKEHITNYLRH